MEFTLSAQLSPSGPFGVPQDKYAVVPTGTRRELHSPVIDRRLRKVVGHGSMSVYRRDDEAVRESLQVDEFKMRFSDNLWGSETQYSALTCAPRVLSGHGS
jgi:hypothetical protein